MKIAWLNTYHPARVASRLLLSAAAIFCFTNVLLAAEPASPKVLVQKNKDGVAVHGYDTVAYFTDKKAVPGNSQFSAEYQGAKYYFVSAAHQALFTADPAKYVPAYGGYCGYAASIGKVRPTDPLVWSIVDGKLILQNTKGAAELWEKDVAGNKTKADKYWPLLEEKKAGVKDPVDGLFSRSVLGNLN